MDVNIQNKSKDKAKHKSDASRLSQTFENSGGFSALAIAKVFLPLLILGFAVITYSYLINSKPKPPKPKFVERAWPVDVVPARFANITPTLKLFGKTVSSRQVEMRALVSGKIISAGKALKEGALIKKGETLIKIDDFDYKGASREAQANLNEAKARLKEMQSSFKLEQENLKYAKQQLELAMTDFKRAEKLAGRGTVTKKLVDDRKVIVSQRRQAVSTATVNLDLQQARQAQQSAIIERLEWKISQAQRRLEETELKAPFDAYVNSVNAEIGRTMNVNDRVAILIDQNNIDVRFTLSDAQYGRLIADEKSLTGRKVKVIWRVGEKPIEYTAKIVRTGAQITAEAGGVEIYAALDKPNQTVAIRSGAFVEVLLKDRSYKQVLRLPQSALYDGDKIYAIKDGRLKAIKVKLVGVAGNDILVICNVIKDTPLLTSRLTTAGEGLKVILRDRNSKAPPDNNKKSQDAKTAAKKSNSTKGI